MSTSTIDELSPPPATLLRPPSFHPAEWPPGHQPQFFVINPMHIITLRKRTRTFGVRVIEKIKAFSERWFSHILLLIFLMIYASIGALLFQWAEAPYERKDKLSIIRTRELIIQNLWETRYFRESEFSKNAYRRLREYEEQIEHHMLNKTPEDSEKIMWTFWGSLFYAGTIFTTIGYGNITPATVAGQSITMVYAFIGIPFLLMVLADLGKLFTRWIKTVVYYVRLFYHTGKLKKARKMGRRATAVPVQYMSVALNKMPYIVYQGRGKKRNSQDKDEDNDGSKSSDIDEKEVKKKDNKHTDKIKSEKMVDEVKEKKEDLKKSSKEASKEAKEIIIQQRADDDDEEFNLPVSLAVGVLLVYMMLGAACFTLWESWSFFECFYFIFISMSTIGFGDYVPDHPMYMMATFIYLLFGLALTSMCINVIQEKLSATFEAAKLRIGTTIGLDANMIMDDDMLSEKSDSSDGGKRRGSSAAKLRRGSKSVQSSPPKSVGDEDIKLDDVVSQTPECDLEDVSTNM